MTLGLEGALAWPPASPLPLPSPSLVAQLKTRRFMWVTKEECPVTRAVTNTNPEEISPVLMPWFSTGHSPAERVHLLPLLHTVKVSTSVCFPPLLFSTSASGTETIRISYTFP